MKKGDTLQLFIPPVGMKMRITEDVTVDLKPVEKNKIGHNEMELLSAIGILPPIPTNSWEDYDYSSTRSYISNNNVPNKITLPKDTVIFISKVYVKSKGWNDDYINIKMLDSPCPVINIWKKNIALTLDGIYKLKVELLEDPVSGKGIY